MQTLDQQERDELVDLVAQAVIDKIEERARIEKLSELVVGRVLDLQREEMELRRLNQESKP